MHNLEYYGFSLLCRVQQSCNSRFKALPSFSGSSSTKVLDFSGLSYGECSPEVAELDLVRRLLGGELTSKALNCLCEACKEAGVASKLYTLSQWNPDRKRGVLIMYKGDRYSSTNSRGVGKRWLAISLGCRESSRVETYGGIELIEELQRETKVGKIISDYEVWVSSRECQEICESFMELGRVAGIFKSSESSEGSERSESSGDGSGKLPS